MCFNIQNLIGELDIKLNYWKLKIEWTKYTGLVPNGQINFFQLSIFENWILPNFQINSIFSNFQKLSIIKKFYQFSIKSQKYTNIENHSNFQSKIISSKFSGCKLTQFTILYTVRKFRLLQEVKFWMKYQLFKLHLHFGFTVISILRFN